MATAIRCSNCNSFKAADGPCKRCGTDSPLEDREMLLANIVLSKKNQGLTDTLTRERRTFREFARAENSIKDYLSHVNNLLQAGSFNKDPIQHRQDLDQESVLVVQLSDLHFIESIAEPYNSYNFLIASKRLAKFAQRIKKTCAANKVSKIVVALLGDIINSDRRLDESRTNQETRAKGTMIAADILQSFLRDINQAAPVDIYGITGNEGRIDKELAWSSDTATNNFDFMVYHILRVCFRGHETINFVGFRSHELYFQVLNRGFLCVHGHQISANTQKSVQELIGKHATQGVYINFVMFGHIHATYLGDYHARNSSLSGGNGYSDHGLNFASRAAQTMHLVTPDSIDTTRVDLQNIDTIQPYAVDPEWAEHFIEPPLISLKKKSITIQVPIS